MIEINILKHNFTKMSKLHTR